METESAVLLAALAAATLLGLLLLARRRSKPNLPERSTPQPSERQQNRATPSNYSAPETAPAGAATPTTPRATIPAGAWASHVNRRSQLLTASERRFESVLRQHLAAIGCRRWRIQSQVGSTALFALKPHGQFVPQWCFDFVITDSDDRIQGIVELTDPTHDDDRRSNTDARKEAGCARLGIPILFVRSHQTDLLRDWISELPGRLP